MSVLSQGLEQAEQRRLNAALQDYQKHEVARVAALLA